MNPVLLINAIIYLAKFYTMQKVTENTTCEKAKFYNPTVYYCDNCSDIPGFNSVNLGVNTTGCFPPVDYQYSFDTQNYLKDCKPAIATEDRLNCISFDTQTQPQFDTNTKNCFPKFIKVDKDQLGQYLLEINCIKLEPEDKYVDPKPTVPQDLCPEYQDNDGTKCVCDATYITSGNACIDSTNSIDSGISKYDLSNAKNFLYRFIESSTSSDEATETNIQSIGCDLIGDVFQIALFNCANEIGQEGCQSLANLCVLHMYDSKKSPCQYLIETKYNKVDE